MPKIVHGAERFSSDHAGGRRSPLGEMLREQARKVLATALAGWSVPR